MKASCFRPRKFFDFSPHPFDVGNLFGFWHKYEDNHYLKKLYKLNHDKFEVFYQYHLAYTLETGFYSEENFFIKVWEIVNDRIKHLKAKDPYSSSHDRYIYYG